MSDQNDQSDSNKPRIVPPATANPTTSAPSRPSPLLAETFEVPSSPTPDELIRTMARLANYLNLLCAEALRSRVVSAANPSVMSMMNASTNLEQGAIAERQQMAMRAQGGGQQFVGPGGQGGGVPPGMPPFRMN
jgi:hypothetical protein